MSENGLLLTKTNLMCNDKSKNQNKSRLTSRKSKKWKKNSKVQDAIKLQSNMSDQKSSDISDRTKKYADNSIADDLKDLSLDDKLERRAQRFKNEETTSKDRNDYGYVSRGEDFRLQRSPKEQELFFKSILFSFVNYCNANTSSELHDDLRNFVEEENIMIGNVESQEVSIASILESLRKLREALISLKPNEFTKKVFLFSVRLSSSMGYFQTFVPSIMHLLQFQNYNLLSELELQEISTLLVLYISHFNQDNSKALRYYFRYLKEYDDQRTLMVLRSWIMNDYYTWIRLYNSEIDSCRASVMKLGLPIVLQTMTSCVSKSYYSMGFKDFENSLLPNNVTFDNLVENYNLAWRKEASVIIFRDRK